MEDAAVMVTVRHWERVPGGASTWWRPAADSAKAVDDFLPTVSSMGKLLVTILAKTHGGAFDDDFLSSLQRRLQIQLSLFRGRSFSTRLQQSARQMRKSED